MIRPGEAIRDYQVLERLSAGGKSQVAKVTRNGELLFLKMFLRPKYDLRPIDGPRGEAVRASHELCESFAARHVEIMGRLGTMATGGGNLVKPTDFFKVGATYHKVYPFLEATPSPAIIDCSVGAKEVFLKTLVLSVRELHSVDIVHGDIKPDNVMLVHHGDAAIAKLIDFDEAYISADPPLHSLGGDDTFVAPEVDRYLDDRAEPEELTVQADMFSFGAVVHRLLTGEPPAVEGGTGTTLAQRIGTGGRVRPFQLPGMSSGFSALVAGTLHREPFDRPTIDDLSDELGMGRLMPRRARPPEPKIITLDDGDRPTIDLGGDPAGGPTAPTEPRQTPEPVREPSGVRHTMRPRNRT